jgi:hypothetical protein
MCLFEDPSTAPFRSIIIAILKEIISHLIFVKLFDMLTVRQASIIIIMVPAVVGCNLVMVPARFVSGIAPALTSDQ